jgi:dTMP kinase
VSGRWLSFEGVEGSGKSTLARNMASALGACGHPVLALREPGSTALGERIRSVVLDAAQERVEPMAELLLMLAARAQLLRERILPALADATTWVLCDRFADASTAYQGYGRGLGREFVEALNRHATADRLPDRTYLVDLDPQVGRGRQTHDPDRMEREALEFHRRVRDGYLDLARREPARFCVLDGALPPLQLLQAAWTDLRRLAPELPSTPDVARPDG